MSDQQVRALRFTCKGVSIERAAVTIDLSARGSFLESLGTERPAVIVVARESLVRISALGVAARVQKQAERRPLWKYLHKRSAEVLLIDTEYSYPKNLLGAIDSLLQRMLDGGPTRPWTGTTVLFGVPKHTFLSVAGSNGVPVTGATAPTGLAELFARRQLRVHPRVIAAWPGMSEAARFVHQLAMRVAKDDQPLLLRGETSTGKRRLAMAIHVVSNGEQAPFARVDCDGYLSERDFERTLFGVDTPARAIPGLLEHAKGGSVYIADIAELPHKLQVRLRNALMEGRFQRLRGRQYRKLEARMLAGTCADLSLLLKAGRFDTQLYYLLHGSPIDVPPLRERPEDIDALARALWRSIAGESSRLPKETLSELRRCPYPGNIRELKASLLSLFRLVGKKPTAAQTRVVLEHCRHSAPTAQA